MSFDLNSITKTGRKRALGIVMHAPAGVGKTTFGVDACEANNGVFIPTEDSIVLDKSAVARFPMVSDTFVEEDGQKKKTYAWENFQNAHKALCLGDHKHGCVVIDTLDFAMPHLENYIIDKFYEGKAEKADAYGAKYADYLREMFKIKQAWNMMLNRGIEVVVLVHSVNNTHKDPYLEQYNRFELNLPGASGKKTSIGDMVKDWADVVLFGTFDVVVNKETMQGSGKNRVAYTEWDPAFDAKSTGLPSKVALSYNKLKELLNAQPGNNKKDK